MLIKDNINSNTVELAPKWYPVADNINGMQKQKKLRLGVNENNFKNHPNQNKH